MEVDAPALRSTAIELEGGTPQEPVLYRLDKDEFSNGMATVRNNLLQIMNSNVFKSTDLRQLIVERSAAAFQAQLERTCTAESVLASSN